MLLGFSVDLFGTIVGFHYVQCLDNFDGFCLDLQPGMVIDVTVIAKETC